MTLTAPGHAPAAPARPRVTVLTDRCAGCQECVTRCPASALTMDAGRWVAAADDALCVGCRQCERTCPFSAITVAGPVLVTPRTAAPPAHAARLAGDTSEVRQGFRSWEEALAEASRCLDCPDPTCVRGCPAHNDIPSFIRAIRDGDLGKAHGVLHATTFLPDVCSRVCDQAAQCEGSCTWSLAGGEAVAIGRLERFAADSAPVPPPRPASHSAGLSVAVVGSGPAGIGAAWELAEAGARVTVYERGRVPGGLISWGIPDFTLPAAVAARPWRQLTAAGVHLRCGRPVGRGDIPGLLAEYDGVILANGAPVPLRVPVPGGDLDGVTDATHFLTVGKDVLATGNAARFRQSFGLDATATVTASNAASAGTSATGATGSPPLVLVLGAGNSAMDVARTARRLGMRATCVDWTDERFAPTRPDELAQARREGVDIRFLRTLIRLDGTFGRVRTATLARTRQRHPGRLPVPVRGEPDTLDVGLVVMATGYRNDPAFRDLLPGTPLPRETAALPPRRWLASGILSRTAGTGHRRAVGVLALGREARLAASALPFQERVWAAGDAICGPATVVEAMAQGRRAARALLAAHPQRGPRQEPRRVLVAFDSRGSRTAHAARLVAGELSGTGAVVRTVPLSQVAAGDLAATDLLVIGTRVEGLVAGGAGPVPPARAWLAALPRVPGLRAAVFATFGVSPRGTVARMSRALTDRGMTVLATGAFGPGRRGIEAGADRLARDLLASAWPERHRTAA